MRTYLGSGILNQRNLVLAAAIALFGFGGAARADLLANGNFNLDEDVSGGPDGWSSWTYGDTAFAAYKNDPANDPFDRDGTPYVNAGNYGDWWSSGGGWYQQVAASAGTPYTFTADCATEGWDNAAGELRVIYLGEFGLELSREVRHSAEYQANLPWSPFTMTAVAPAGTQLVKVEFATWGARGAVLWDNASLLTASVWNVDAGGDIANAGNWIGGTPGGVDAAARFLSAITASRTVAIDAPVTLGSISFVNTQGYVLAGTSNLRLETSSGYSLVDVQSGTHRINLPLTLASDAYFAVSAGATLEIGDPLTVEAGKALRPSGGGTISYQSSIELKANASITFANDTHATSLTLASGASAAIATHGAAAIRTITLDALTLAADAKLDVADNKLVVNYTGTSPAPEIRAALVSGYNGGAWNGPGIGSSVVTAGHAVGYIDSAGAVTLRYTLNGDASLDGTVNFDDLLLLAQNYGITSGATWSKGDFNYSSVVEFDDLLALAQNYGGTLSAVDVSNLSPEFAADWKLALSMVPEPASAGLIGLSLVAVRRRRAASRA